MKKDFEYTKTGFEVPKNYFGEFNGRLFSKMKGEAFLQEKKATGLSIPKGYFENFNVAFPKETKVVPLFKRRETWTYAASIAAIFVLVISLFKNSPQVAVSFSDIGKKSIESYIESGQIDFSDMEIQTYLLEETELGDLRFDGISDEEIFDYLATHENELSYLNR